MRRLAFYSGTDKPFTDYPRLGFVHELRYWRPSWFIEAHIFGCHVGVCR